MTGRLRDIGKGMGFQAFSIFHISALLGHFTFNIRGQLLYVHYVTEGHCDYSKFPLIMPSYLFSTYLTFSLFFLFVDLMTS